ncbi:hypothetical protein LINGRAHAP2_LOCUS4954 [Linum grandiflorum]
MHPQPSCEAGGLGLPPAHVLFPWLRWPYPLSPPPLAQAPESHLRLLPLRRIASHSGDFTRFLQDFHYLGWCVGDCEKQSFFFPERKSFVSHHL